MRKWKELVEEKRGAVVETIRGEWERDRAARVAALETALSRAVEGIGSAHRSAWDRNSDAARDSVLRTVELANLRAETAERAGEALAALTAEERAREQGRAEALRKRGEAREAEERRAAELVAAYRAERDRLAREEEEMQRVEKERIEAGQHSLRDFRVRADSDSALSAFELGAAWTGIRRADRIAHTCPATLSARSSHACTSSACPVSSKSTGERERMAGEAMQER